MERKDLVRAGYRVISGLLFLASAGGSLTAHAGECRDMVRDADEKAMLIGNQCYYVHPDQEKCRAIKKGQKRMVGDVCFALETAEPLEYGPVGDGLNPYGGAGEGIKVTVGKKNGLEIFSKLGVEVAAVLQNNLRSSGGNELSNGDYVVTLDVRAEHAIDGDERKKLFLDLSLVNRQAPTSWDVDNDFHSWNRLRTNGYVSRPTDLATVGGEFKVGEYQTFKVMLGSFQSSGLKPIEGKPGQYHQIEPYTLVVRYDQGMMVDYKMADAISEVIHASFAVVDGDYRLGQPSVRMKNGDANSYPAAALNLKVNTVALFHRAFGVGEVVRQYGDVYFCASGHFGDYGSYPGAKRRANDLTGCVGLNMKVAGSDLEVRYHNVKYERNQQFDETGKPDGNGTHTPAVVSKGSGVEVALRNVELGGCSWDFYTNKYQLNNTSGKPDGELFWGANGKSVKGWTVGATCKNPGGIKGLKIFAYKGRVTPNNPGELNAGTWQLLGNGGGNPYAQGGLGVSYDLNIF